MSFLSLGGEGDCEGSVVIGATKEEECTQELPRGTGGGPSATSSSEVGDGHYAVDSRGAAKTGANDGAVARRLDWTSVSTLEEEENCGTGTKFPFSPATTSVSDTRSNEPPPPTLPHCQFPLRRKGQQSQSSLEDDEVPSSALMSAVHPSTSSPYFAPDFASMVISATSAEAVTVPFDIPSSEDQLAQGLQHQQQQPQQPQQVLLHPDGSITFLAVQVPPDLLLPQANDGGGSSSSRGDCNQDHAGEVALFDQIGSSVQPGEGNCSIRIENKALPPSMEPSALLEGMLREAAADVTAELDHGYLSCSSPGGSSAVTSSSHSREGGKNSKLLPMQLSTAGGETAVSSNSPSPQYHHHHPSSSSSSAAFSPSTTIHDYDLELEQIVGEVNPIFQAEQSTVSSGSTISFTPSHPVPSLAMESALKTQQILSRSLPSTAASSSGHLSSYLSRNAQDIADEIARGLVDRALESDRRQLVAAFQVNGGKSAAAKTAAKDVAAVEDAFAEVALGRVTERLLDELLAEAQSEASSLALHACGGDARILPRLSEHLSAETLLQVELGDLCSDWGGGDSSFYGLRRSSSLRTGEMDFLLPRKPEKKGLSWRGSQHVCNDSCAKVRRGELPAEEPEGARKDEEEEDEEEVPWFETGLQRRRRLFNKERRKRNKQGILMSSLRRKVYHCRCLKCQSERRELGQPEPEEAIEVREMQLPQDVAVEVPIPRRRGRGRPRKFPRLEDLPGGGLQGRMTSTTEREDEGEEEQTSPGDMRGGERETVVKSVVVPSSSNGGEERAKKEAGEEDEDDKEKESGKDIGKDNGGGRHRKNQTEFADRRRRRRGESGSEWKEEEKLFAQEGGGGGVAGKGGEGHSFLQAPLSEAEAKRDNGNENGRRLTSLIKEGEEAKSEASGGSFVLPPRSPGGGMFTGLSPPVKGDRKRNVEGGGWGEEGVESTKRPPSTTQSGNPDQEEEELSDGLQGCGGEGRLRPLGEKPGDDEDDCGDVGGDREADRGGRHRRGKVTDQGSQNGETRRGGGGGPSSEGKTKGFFDRQSVEGRREGSVTMADRPLLGLRRSASQGNTPPQSPLKRDGGKQGEELSPNRIKKTPSHEEKSSTARNSPVESPSPASWSSYYSAVFSPFPCSPYSNDCALPFAMEDDERDEEEEEEVHVGGEEMTKSGVESAASGSDAAGKESGRGGRVSPSAEEEIGTGNQMGGEGGGEDVKVHVTRDSEGGGGKKIAEGGLGSASSYRDKAEGMGEGGGRGKEETGEGLPRGHGTVNGEKKDVKRGRELKSDSDEEEEEEEEAEGRMNRRGEEFCDASKERGGRGKGGGNEGSDTASTQKKGEMAEEVAETVRRGEEGTLPTAQVATASEARREEEVPRGGGGGGGGTKVNSRGKKRAMRDDGKSLAESRKRGDKGDAPYPSSAKGAGRQFAIQKGEADYEDGRKSLQRDAVVMRSEEPSRQTKEAVKKNNTPEAKSRKVDGNESSTSLAGGTLPAPLPSSHLAYRGQNGITLAEDGVVKGGGKKEGGGGSRGEGEDDRKSYGHSLEGGRKKVGRGGRGRRQRSPSHFSAAASNAASPSPPPPPPPTREVAVTEGSEAAPRKRAEKRREGDLGLRRGEIKFSCLATGGRGEGGRGGGGPRWRRLWGDAAQATTFRPHSARPRITEGEQRPSSSVAALQKREGGGGEKSRLRRMEQQKIRGANHPGKHSPVPGNAPGRGGRDFTSSLRLRLAKSEEAESEGGICPSDVGINRRRGGAKPAAVGRRAEEERRLAKCWLLEDEVASQSSRVIKRRGGAADARGTFGDQRTNSIERPSLHQSEYFLQEVEDQMLID